MQKDKSVHIWPNTKPGVKPQEILLHELVHALDDAAFNHLSEHDINTINKLCVKYDLDREYQDAIRHAIVFAIAPGYFEHDTELFNDRPFPKKCSIDFNKNASKALAGKILQLTKAQIDSNQPILNQDYLSKLT